jgi:type I restriction enzyme M protein
MATPKGFQDKVSFVWSVADLLRGDFKPHEYGQVILPFVVLRRLECALEKNKDAVIERNKKLGDIKDPEAILNSISGHNFYNVSPFNLSKILQDPNKVASNLNTYIHAFSPSASEVLDKYGFPEKIRKLESSDLLYQIVSKFADLDLSEESVSNEAMGYIFEELLRRFSEMSNETAGEHYTPREVIRLMVNLLFIEDSKSLTGDKPIRSIYDPACGTGGMLSIAEEHLHEMNPNIVLNVFGQELNDETWAIARSDLMIKGQDPKRITRGNSLTDEDGHAGTLFDYCISNPPYGVDWKKYEKQIRDESEKLGFSGRYGAGLPRVSDGSFLFIQHMINKMKPYDSKKTEGGSRLAIILSGSPLFSGQAGSGESEIRKWIIENDWLEGIVAMPDQMFYNTGIGTYVWIISNRKDEKAKGKVRLVDARDLGTKVRKSLGDKRKELTSDSIIEITRIYSEALITPKDEKVKIMLNEEFGYAKLSVEQPLRRVWIINDETIKNSHPSIREKIADIKHQSFITPKLAESEFVKHGLSGKEIILALKAIACTDSSAEPVMNKAGKAEPDPELRDSENVELPIGFIGLSDDEKIVIVKEIAESYLNKEIHPYVPDAWIDHNKTKIGYEIPFTRQFYTYVPPRPVSEIRAQVEELQNQIQSLMNELS